MSGHSGFSYYIQAVCVIKSIFCTTQIHGQDICISASASRQLFDIYAIIVKVLRHNLLCALQIESEHDSLTGKVLLPDQTAYEGHVQNNILQLLDSASIKNVTRLENTAAFCAHEADIPGQAP